MEPCRLWTVLLGVVLSLIFARCHDIPTRYVSVIRKNVHECTTPNSVCGDIWRTTRRGSDGVTVNEVRSILNCFCSVGECAYNVTENNGNSVRNSRKHEEVLCPLPDGLRPCVGDEVARAYAYDGYGVHLEVYCRCPYHGNPRALGVDAKTTERIGRSDYFRCARP